MAIFSYMPTFSTKHAKVLLELTLALLLSELSVLSELRGEIRSFAHGSGVVVCRTGVTRGAKGTRSTRVVRGLLFVALVVQGIIVSGVSVTGMITGATTRVQGFALIGRTFMSPSFTYLFGVVFPVSVVD